ncbi:MAG: sodium:calcium antiporter [Candidatus Thermoplasmatota archaeon]|nr:sodium:calcium antiporter [Candidatus Thermoplasmatota archaeon]
MIQLAVVAILIAALAIILVSCEIFTNGVEWLGCRLGLAETATGSILAAVGTAMPETIIPLIAIFFGTAEQGEKMGEGAILGAPFMLGTLAMFVGGVTVLYAYRKGRRTDHIVLRRDHAERDMKYFMMMYTVALVSGLIGLNESIDRTYLNYGLAGLLMVAYAHYLHRTLKDEPREGENSCPALYACVVCKLNPAKGRLGFLLILLQVTAALLGIIIGAKFFVTEVEEVSTAVGVPPMILMFLIAPIATELPEKFNSVIWYLRSKDTLAFGNITGAMVFQSSFPVSIGLVFTHWQLEPINIASILIALLASAWLFMSIRKKGGISYRVMLASGSLYILYIIMLAVLEPGASA